MQKTKDGAQIRVTSCWLKGGSPWLTWQTC